jgi:hypothetical protein
VIVSPATSTIPCSTRKARATSSVAYRDLLLEIERRHELAEHRGLADRLQAAAAGRDEGPFLDQIEHVAGAAGRAVPVLLVERSGVAIDEPTPKDIFRRQR